MNVEVRGNAGFTEKELEKAVQATHYLILDRPEVRDASSWFDFSTKVITTNVVLEKDVDSAVLADLQQDAEGNLERVIGRSLLADLSISVERSQATVLGGDDNNGKHLGGEDISSCTSGFAVVIFTTTKGIATSGHCPDAQSDDGDNLPWEAQYLGSFGDFQWHEGTEPIVDDFYSENGTTLEVNLRDVSATGLVLVGQALCKNGVNGYKDCQDVRKLNVCNGIKCSLVEMDARLAASGDSGGPVFWGNTAYGFHQGYIYDPWPASRDVYSRADRIDDALGVNVLTN